MSDSIREEFEAAFAEHLAKKGLHARRQRLPDGRYEYVDTAAAWWAWQASREALVIELPSVKCIDLHGYSARDVLNFCEKAVRDSGAKSK